MEPLCRNWDHGTFAYLMLTGESEPHVTNAQTEVQIKGGSLPDITPHYS